MSTCGAGSTSSSWLQPLLRAGCMDALLALLRSLPRTSGVPARDATWVALQVLCQDEIGRSSKRDIAAAAVREVRGLKPGTCHAPPPHYQLIKDCPSCWKLSRSGHRAACVLQLSALHAVTSGERAEWSAAAGCAALALHHGALAGHGSAARDSTGGGSAGVKHPALLWSEATLRRRHSTELWHACAQLLAGRLRTSGAWHNSVEDTANFAARVLRAAPFVTRSEPCALAAVCKPALQLLLASYRERAGHSWRPPESTAQLRTSLDGLFRELSEAAASVSEDGQTAWRLLRFGNAHSQPGVVPGQTARACVREAMCWTLLAKAQCVGEVGVASELGEDIAALLEPDAKMAPDVCFVLPRDGYARPEAIPLALPLAADEQQETAYWVDLCRVSFWAASVLLRCNLTGHM